MKKNLFVNLLAVIIGITLFINALLFPIVKVLTNIDTVNAVLDKVALEERVLDVWSDILILQTDSFSLDDNTKATLEKTYKTHLVSPDALRKQRVAALQTLYQSLEDSTVPQFTFHLENPLYKIREKITDSAKSVFDNIISVPICTKFEMPAVFGVKPKLNGDEYCFSFRDFIGKQGNSENDSNVGISKELVYTTTFGITKDNVYKIHKMYIFFKKLPVFLALLDIVLFVIEAFILVTFNKQASWKELILEILRPFKALVLPGIFWMFLPVVIHMFEPFAANKDLVKKSVEKLGVITSNDVIIKIQVLINDIAYRFSEEMFRSFVLMFLVALGVMLTVAIAIFAVHKVKEARAEDPALQDSTEDLNKNVADKLNTNTNVQ